MRVIFNKFISLILALNLILLPAFASENIKIFGHINQDFSFNDIPQEIVFKTNEDYTFKDGTIIPKNSDIVCEVMQVQRERRWHKSGYILCKLKSYKVPNEDYFADMSDANIYLALRKYEAIDGKDAAILTTEIIVTQAAGIVGSCFIFFAPVDIVYFFTKGAILRDKHYNWFKAGVHDAYDNSICWFWLKGKPIELQESEPVKVQSIKEKKALKLNSQIAKRNQKQAVKDSKKQAKLEAKQEKVLAKQAKEEAKNPEKFARKMEKRRIKQEKKEMNIAKQIARQEEILTNRAEKARLRKERKAAKKALKNQQL